MKPWSDSPIHHAFCVKIFADTNILAYLVDNTYQGLNDFFELSKNSPFTELVSSKYVMFEFVGIRKREHYLRKVASRAKKSRKGEVNFSSLTNQKYLNNFSAPEVDFEDIVKDINTDVNEEIALLMNDFQIDFSYSTFHEDQLTPTFDVCLSSKISHHDSLVLISSILPTEKLNNENIIVLTHDDNFCSSVNNPGEINSVFKDHKLFKPYMYLISHINANGQSIDLKKTDDKNLVNNCFISIVLYVLKEKNRAFYLGNTFPPKGKGFPSNCVCFELTKEEQLPQNVYVTIIGKDLNFVYTTKKRIEYFMNNNNRVVDGYAVPKNKNNISFLARNFDDQNNEIEVPQEIIDELRVEGNLVFIHPDSQI